MQRSLTPVIVALVAIAIALVGLDAARERHTAAAASRPVFALARANSAPKNISASSASKSSDAAAADDSSDDSMGGDPDDKVIRFARDPSPMPPFLATDLDGQTISTAAYRGKVVLVSFWATWCPPCREEIPLLLQLESRYKDKLQIIGVSMDDDTPAEVREFTRAEHMDYPVVMDKARISEEYGGVPALPTAFVIDTNGRVVQKHVGLYPAEVYDNEIRSLLGMHVDEPVESFVDNGQIFLKNVQNATELPGVDFSGLTPGLKKAALKRLNTEMCTCGCKMTIAECRMMDADCATSKALAARIIREIRAAANPEANPPPANHPAPQKPAGAEPDSAQNR